MNKNKIITIELFITIIVTSLYSHYIEESLFSKAFWMGDFRIKNYIIVLFIIFTVILIYKIYILLKKYNKIKKDYDNLLNPYNHNIEKFNVGDTVIQKSGYQRGFPALMSVFKIHNNVIECRINGNLIKYAPEELLTAEETKEFLNHNLENSNYVTQERQAMMNEYLP